MKIIVASDRFWPVRGGAEEYTLFLAEELNKRNKVKVMTFTEEDGWNLIDTSLNISYEDEIRPKFGGELCRLRLRPWQKLSFYIPFFLYHFYRKQLTIVYKNLGNNFILRVLRGAKFRLCQFLSNINVSLISALWRAFYACKVRRLLHGCDVLHIVETGIPGICSGNLIKIAKERLKKPVVYTSTLHHENPQDIRMFYILKNADAIVALTPKGKQMLVNLGAQPKKVFVTGAGPIIDSSLNLSMNYKKEHNIDGFMILFAGAKVLYKGYKLILEAAPYVWEAFPKTCFVFLGRRTPESEEVFSRINDPRIIETGHVSGREKVEAFADCDIFCMPSFSESFGLVFLEAWNFSKPVIAGDISVERTFIEAGKDGFLVKNSPGDLADYIIKLLQDDKLRREMGRAGKEKLDSSYTWNKIAEQMENIYLRVIPKDNE